MNRDGLKRVKLQPDKLKPICSGRSRLRHVCWTRGVDGPNQIVPAEPLREFRLALGELMRPSCHLREARITIEAAFLRSSEHAARGMNEIRVR